MQAWAIRRNIGGYLCCFGVGGNREFAWAPYLHQAFLFPKREYAENEVQKRGLFNTCRVVSIMLVEDDLSAREQQLLENERNKVKRFIDFLTREDAKNNNAKQLAIGESFGSGSISYKALWKDLFNEDLEKVEVKND